MMSQLDVRSAPYQYVELALAIEQHSPGYVDAFYGPKEWRDTAVAKGKRPLSELEQSASELAGAISHEPSFSPQRREFLTRQVRAMQMSLAILDGDHPSLEEEVAALFDVSAQWTETAVIESAHRRLDELLPPGDSLYERMMTRKRALEVPVEQVQPHLGETLGELRERTQQIIQLPEAESFDLQLVSHQPWIAYNWYLGNGHSRIDVNTDLPWPITGLVPLMAHEGYPGHHTERTMKDILLFRGHGDVEHSVVLLNTPECVVSEGIAVCALETIVPRQELIDWEQRELFPPVNLGHLEAEREYEIDLATRSLSGAVTNAAFLLHSQGVPENKVATYLQQQALVSEGEAAKLIEFMTNPLFRSFIFTYTSGRDLLQKLFEKRGDREGWYKRLLMEPVTPSQIRAWIEAESSSPA